MRIYSLRNELASVIGLALMAHNKAAMPSSRHHDNDVQCFLFRIASFNVSKIEGIDTSRTLPQSQLTMSKFWYGHHECCHEYHDIAQPNYALA